MDLRIFGVTTNNLKDLDICVETGAITSVAGVSAGGKSSLAYGTIYALCNEQFSALEHGSFKNPSYKIRGATGLRPAVAISQDNENVNPRSTIYSFLNLASVLSAGEAEYRHNIPYHRLKLNKPDNACLLCDGLGAIADVSEDLVAQGHRSLEDSPYAPWRSSDSDKKRKLLLAFANDVGIDVDVPLSELPEHSRRQLLYGRSNSTYDISYSYRGKRRRRRLKYVGVMSEIEEKVESKKKSDIEFVRKYSDFVTCPKCDGSRLKRTLYESYEILGIRFSKFLTSSIADLKLALRNERGAVGTFADRLLDILDNAGLGYLTLARSIPSLSGGELQKLKFAKLLLSSICGIVIVIDEISSQLHPSDFAMVLDGLRGIKSDGNTILLVEHNEYFIARSDHVLTLGPGAGQHGGYLLPRVTPFSAVEAKEYHEPDKFVRFQGVTKHNLRGISARFPQSAVTAIVGRSGSGKSSLAEYLDQKYGHVLYVSQSSLRGNVRSTVSSYLGLPKVVADWFERQTSVGSELFLLGANSLGVCGQCDGTGIIRYERSYESSVDVTCPQCDGSLFNQASEDIKVQGVNIRAFYEMSFSEISRLTALPSRVGKVCEMSDALGIGHLSLGRKSSSLSGGERRRLKLLRTLLKNSAGNILLVDEPGSGLDDGSIVSLMCFLNGIKASYEAIIVIDHKPAVFVQCDYLIEMGPFSGEKGGVIVFEGDPATYLEKHKAWVE